MNISPLFCFAISLLFGCSPYGSAQQIKENQERLKYLFKTEFDTALSSYGQHIEVKQPPLPKDTTYFESRDDRDIIAGLGYTKEDKIKILGEFLAFQNDTIKSNKKYHFRAGYHMTSVQDEDFTVEMEALFSFTRMLTVGLPPLKPVLINRLTGERLNGRRSKMDELYAIHRKWLIDNSKTDFLNMTLPLTDTPYGWLGDEADMTPFLKKSL